MQIFNLFPTPVAFFNLNRELTTKELNFVDNLEQRPNDNNLTSVNSNILNNKELTSVSEFIKTSLNSYFKDMYQPENDVSLRITQSWANYTKPGQSHHKHAHPNSFISGVFYIKANKEIDRIHFYNDKYFQLKIPTKNWNLYNSNSWWLPVGSCELILFPSSLVHNVETVQGVDERVSLSFNTFPIGTLGSNESLDELILR